MARPGNNFWSVFAKNYADTTSKKLGEEAVSTVVEIGAKVGQAGYVGVKVGQVCVNAAQESVKSYGMHLLVTGMVNIANEVGAPAKKKKKKKLQMVTSYTPIGMSDKELLLKGVKLILKKHIPPLKPMMGVKKAGNHDPRAGL